MPVSGRPKTGDKGETFAKILGMDDPLSKTPNTSQRRILPEYSALRTVMFRAATRENNPLSSAQHLDTSARWCFTRTESPHTQSMEAVAEWI